MKFAVCAVFSILFVIAAGEHFPNPAPEKYIDYIGEDYNDYDYWGDVINTKESNNANDNDFKDIDQNQRDELFSDDNKDLRVPDTFDGMKDYQIEDNRSDSNENIAVEIKSENDDSLSETDTKPIHDQNAEPDAKDAQNNDNNGDTSYNIVAEIEPEADDALEEIKFDESAPIAVADDFWGDVLKDNEAPLPVPQYDDLNKILEDTRNILKEDSDRFDENLKNDPEGEEIKKPMEELKESGDTADYMDELENEASNEDSEEIKQMIDQINKFLEDSNYNNEDVNKSDEDVFSDNNNEDNSNEDTVQKAYDDLNEDLEKLFETFDKLKDDVSEEEENDEEVVNDVKDYEEKFGWPYKEAAILAARDDEYENIDDSNLSDIFKENAVETAVEEVDSIENDEDIKNSDEDKLDTDEDTLKANIEPVLESFEANEMGKDYQEKFSESEADYDDTNDIIEGVIEKILPDKHPYGDDGLDNSQPNESEAEEIEQVKYNKNDEDNIKSMNDVEQIPKKSKMVDDLSDTEFNNLMAQFQTAHQEDFDLNSENFNKNIAPIHITLSADEPVVITSPDYPDPYPTNNIIDWIFEGDGTGIELNITDFALNGALGDYLLVKPGGVDDSGHEGLIFSYRLDSERKYRFFDVKRMFVRFKAEFGIKYFRGFQFSVKMIHPPSEDSFLDSPEMEAVLNPPEHTLTLNLAGLTLPEFRNIQDEFISLVADMAKHYINENDIYYGYNSTLEVTQITGTAVCRIQWPNYETCVEVTFGIPLNYGDEDLEPRLNTQDLDDMWTTMILREDFSARLDAMGIKEYLMPDDRTVLTVWLVIGAGVVISMAMLAFALWRFSCFEDYTRMKVFSDTDSMREEKRNLDLYPTPHQTLPPLYAESEYKWAEDKYNDSTRVDMGGFANKSYMREDIYNFDSDEDVITPRDRYATNV